MSGTLIGGYVATFAGAASLAIVALPIREMVRSAPARRMLSKHAGAVRTAIVFVVLVVSVCAVILPARPFPHYALLFIWPLALLAGLAWSLASSWPARGEGGVGTPLRSSMHYPYFASGALPSRRRELTMIPRSPGLRVFSAPASCWRPRPPTAGATVDPPGIRGMQLPLQRPMTATNIEPPDVYILFKPQPAQVPENDVQPPYYPNVVVGSRVIPFSRKLTRELALRQRRGVH